MEMDIIWDALVSIFQVICISFLGSFVIGATIDSFKNKKWYGFGLYLPLMLIWAKYFILFLIFK